MLQDSRPATALTRASPHRESSRDRQDECIGRQLAEAASPYMHALSLSAGDTPHRITLKDDHGKVVDMVARRGTASTAEPSTSARSAARREVRLRSGKGVFIGSLRLCTASRELTARLEFLQDTIANAVRADLVAQELRAVVGVMRQVRTVRSEELERLHQDLVQGYTAARLQLELSTLQIRRGEPAPLLVRARAAFLRFKRLARIWLLLAKPESLALGRHKIDATALLAGLVELLHTEASIAGVWLRFAVGPAVLVSLSESTLARALYGRIQEALWAAGPQGVVELTLSPDAVVSWCAEQASSRGPYALPSLAQDSRCASAC